VGATVDRGTIEWPPKFGGLAVRAVPARRGTFRSNCLYSQSSDCAADWEQSLYCFLSKTRLKIPRSWLWNQASHGCYREDLGLILPPGLSTNGPGPADPINHQALLFSKAVVTGLRKKRSQQVVSNAHGTGSARRSVFAFSLPVRLLISTWE
jgi:hypothetical protein